MNQKDELSISKSMLLMPISRFYLIPEFEIENSTMDQSLLNAYFEVVFKLIHDFGIKVENFEYHARNFGFPTVDNQDNLLIELNKEQKDPSRNDSRYRLGFRSIWVILNDNIDVINPNYIGEINKILTPFFLHYKHKELFIPGLELKS